MTADISFTAKLVPFRDGDEHAAVQRDSWFITHGLGTPASGTYTEVSFDPELMKNVTVTDQVRYEIIRQVADQLYGSRWAFAYPPKEYVDAVGRWDLRRRERVHVTEIRVRS